MQIRSRQTTSLVMNFTSLVLLVLLAVVSRTLIGVNRLVNAEPDASPGNGIDQLSADSFLSSSSPKRQYLIAPRVGRSANPNGGWAQPVTIDQLDWARASPLFLFMNSQAMGHPRRVIGTRSMGLMPQARIGRRASPMSGLMPVARVGRSVSEQQSDEQEVALSAINDSTYGDAIDAIVFVASLGRAEASPAAGSQQSQGEHIEMPVHRAPAFVPRLGKRENPYISPMYPVAGGLSQLDLAMARSLLGSLKAQQPEPELMLANPGELTFRRPEELPIVRNDLGSYLVSMAQVQEQPLIDISNYERGSNSVKRVPFTPRIGR